MEASSERPPPEEAPPPRQPEPPPPPAADPSQPPPSANPSAATAGVPPSSSSSADPSSTTSSSQNPSQTPQPQLQSQPQSQSQSQSLSQSQPQQSTQQPLQRPPAVATARPQAPFPHFVHHFASSASSSSSGPLSSSSTAVPSRPLNSPLPSSTTSAAATQMPRGGLAIGVPAHSAHIPRAQQSPMSFSQFGQTPPFSQPFGSLPRVPEQSPTANAQARPPIQGIQNIGMIGSLSSPSQMRPSGSSGPQQQRLGQLPLRSPSPSSNQTFNSQKFSGPTLLRGTSIVSPSSPLPVPQQQLVSAQGKQMHAPSVTSSSHRPQVRPHVLQQRPNNIQQHSLSLPTTSSQQQTSASQQQQQQQKLHQPFQLQQQLQQQQQQKQQQQVLQHQSQEHHNQQNVQLRNQQTMRPFGPTTSRPTAQAGVTQPGTSIPVVNTDASESTNRLISKRSIQELVNQIDPSENLDTEVEDALIDIAEDFVDSVVGFACSLAKHRKSTTLEAKDILLHAERNWHITLPGYSGDDIRGCKKQTTNDIHKERLAVIKKSMLATGETGTTRNPTTGQATANAKAHTSKAPVIVSPKP